MSKAPYRVECIRVRGQARYYLVLDVAHGGVRKRVKAYISSEPPSPELLRSAWDQKGSELLARAIRKKAELSAAAYQSRWLTDQQIRKLEALRWRTQQLRSTLSASELEAYEREREVRYVHGTTAIEGNTLTLAQTSDLLDSQRIPAAKSLREINEVQNYHRVRALRDAHQGPITKRFIQRLHERVLANIDHDQAGQFRRTDAIGILGCDLRVSPAVLIEEELDALLEEHALQLRNQVHPVEAAIWFHYQFETIHPFTDGNGRVGRELLNLHLTRSGYPRLILQPEDRGAYLDALRAGNEEAYATMVVAFADLLEIRAKT